MRNMRNKSLDMGEDPMKKKCRLCGSMFETTRFWQKFCCPEHQKEYWKKIQQDRYALNRKIEELEKKIERLSIQ